MKKYLLPIILAGLSLTFAHYQVQGGFVGGWYAIASIITGIGAVVSFAVSEVAL